MIQQSIWRFDPPRRVLVILPYSVPLSKFDLDEQEHMVIIACPNPPKEAIKAGKAVNVPSKVYDVQVLIDQLPHGYHPEVVQVTARDLSYRPQNLVKFGCPSVMKLGDTGHWGNGSISHMVKYAKELQCDYHWCYQNPQHLHFFAEVGLKNVFWLPGTIGTPLPILNLCAEHKHGMIFRGSLQVVHEQRRRILDFLASSGLPINTGTASYDQCLEDYAQSTISFNCSGNGDLNRRVYEILLAGGFLLTDRLSAQTGLYAMFQEGVHLECYGDEIELVEKAKYYLSHPEKAREIAERGHRELMDKYSPAIAKQMLHNAIFDGNLDPLFRLGHDDRSSLLAQPYAEVLKRIRIYELVQELQALNSRLNILCAGLKNERILSDLSDLSRVELNKPSSGGYDLIYSEDAGQLTDLMKKLKPGGLLAVEQGTVLSKGHGLQRVSVVDAITRSVLAKGSLDVYRAPGTGSTKFNVRRFHEILKSFFR